MNDSLRYLVVLFGFLLAWSQLLAQTKIDTAAIIEQLAVIHDRDQKTRTAGDSVEYVSFIDSSNLAQVEALNNQHGWPGKSFVGSAGNSTVFLVIQHAELATQEKYFPLMQQSVAEGESRPQDLALLQDRILMRQGNDQIYGSQVVFNKSTGAPEFWPIEEERNVNVRRAEVGLQPLEEYAKNFGIDYHLPEE